MKKKLDNRLKWHYFLFFWTKKKIRNIFNYDLETKKLSKFDKSILNIKKNFKNNKKKKNLFCFCVWKALNCSFL